MTPVKGRSGRHVWNQYVIRAQRRDELRQYLAAAGVGTEIYYPIPLHLQQCFAYLGYRAGELPEAERAAHEVLALPVFPELSAAQIDHVAGTIRRFHTAAEAPSQQSALRNTPCRRPQVPVLPSGRNWPLMLRG